MRVDRMKAHMPSGVARRQTQSHSRANKTQFADAGSAGRGVLDWLFRSFFRVHLMIEPPFQDKTVSVVGLGKLGLPLAACIAARGFQVVGVDCDARKVADLNLGRAATFEPQLEETIRCSAERIRAVQDIESAVALSEITFVVVATPSEDDGSFSLRYVLSACEDIGRALRTKHSHHLVVLTSTVMPGSTGGIVRETLEKASDKRVGRDFGLCYSPEFIALGSVIHDLLHPDFLLIGESDPHSVQFSKRCIGISAKTSRA